MEREKIRSGVKYQPPHKVAGKGVAAVSKSVESDVKKRDKALQGIDIQHQVKSTKPVNSNSVKIDTSQERARQRQLRFQTKSEGYGFVSRGEENRLQRSAPDREQFFQQILKDFVEFCNQNPGKVLQQLVNTLGADSGSKSHLNNVNDGSEGSSHTEENSGSILSQLGITSSKAMASSLSSILSSLRKLREALLHSPLEDFTKRVYLFLIRLSALTNHYQTYLPCITYLLRDRPISILSKLEYTEISTLLVLHTCHFNNNHSAALAYYYRYLQGPDGQDKTNIDTLRIVLSRVHNDYHTWIQLYNVQSDHACAALMRMGLNSVLSSMVETISKSYFSLDFNHLEKHMLPRGIDFKYLQANCKISWTCSESTVIVRPRKSRTNQ